MEPQPGHNSQENLDKTSDKEELQTTPRSHHSARSGNQTGDEDSPLTAINRMFRTAEQESQSDHHAHGSGEQSEELTDYQLARDRSRREIRTPARFA